MGIPNFIPSKIPINVPNMNDSDNPKFSLKVLDFNLEITCLSVGNPHAVCIMDENVENFPLVEVGTLVEKHGYFPNRINFEIVNIISREKIRARIFERGAGETLACGTGACAVAVCAMKYKLVDCDELIIRFKGGDIVINWNGLNSSNILMTGGYEEIFSASIEI